MVQGDEDSIDKRPSNGATRAAVQSPCVRVQECNGHRVGFELVKISELS